VKKAWQILKYVVASIAAIGTLYGTFEVYDSSRDRQVETQEQIRDNHNVVMQKLSAIEVSVDTLYIRDERRNDMEHEIIQKIDKTEGRLLYYINHSNDMTNEQILDAFELGFSKGKKKELTVSDLQGGKP
jgi:hypothetical protein